MPSDVDEATDLPASLRDLLEQHDPETLVAIRHYCDSLLDEYELADEVESRTYG